MRRPPQLTEVGRCPVTVGIGLLAVGITIAWKSDVNIDRLFMNFRAWHGEYWRTITSILPHVNAFHLIFNLYWLWVFGVLVEETFGSLRMAGLVLALGVGSSVAEHAVSGGGVGLSGVNYGLFGFLWVLSRHDERFWDAVDSQVVALLVGWFFLCIVLTYTKVMAVGNVAHGVGAALGILVGFAVSTEGRRKLLWSGAATVIFASACLASAFGHPILTTYATGGHDLARAAYLEQRAGRNEAAIDLYRRALEQNNREASWWYNLGIAYASLERNEEAHDAYQHAVDLDRGSKDYRHALADCKASLADRSEDSEEAVRLYKEAIALNDQNAMYWTQLGVQYVKLGRMELANDAMEHAMKLFPKVDK
jgi:membrane associated rhomboid family serine protease